MKMKELPDYTDEQLNGLRLMATHSEVVSEAWLNHAKAIKNLLLVYEEYKKNPNTRSTRLAYQAALINLESAKASIHEIKDLAYNAGINEWLP